MECILLKDLAYSFVAFEPGLTVYCPTDCDRRAHSRHVQTFPGRTMQSRARQYSCPEKNEQPSPGNEKCILCPQEAKVKVVTWNTRRINKWVAQRVENGLQRSKSAQFELSLLSFHEDFQGKYNLIFFFLPFLSLPFPPSLPPSHPSFICVFIHLFVYYLFCCLFFNLASCRNLSHAKSRDLWPRENPE